MYERAAQLTAALQQHGIHVERFDVTADGSGDTGDRLPGDGGSDVTTEGHEDDTPAGLFRVADTVPSDETGVSNVWDVEPEAAAVAKTRLDIKV
jgi:hypothetical protein